MIDITQLRTILEHPAINVSGLAKHVGISKRHMFYIRDGKRNLTPAIAERISVAVKEIHNRTKP